jgi:hypothetical protein
MFSKSYHYHHLISHPTRYSATKLLRVLLLTLTTSNTGSTSILSLRLTETALSQDPTFLEWCELHLTMTIGQEPKQVWLTSGNEGKGTIQMVERITSEMGRSFMGGVLALGPSIAGAACQGSGYGMDMSDNLGGKLYSEKNVATLKGYCSVVNTRDIPVIWDAIQHTKEIASH